MNLIDKLPDYDESALARIEENCRRLAISGTVKQKVEAETVLLAISVERLRRRPPADGFDADRKGRLMPAKTLELVRKAAIERKFVSYGEVARHSGMLWNNARRAMPKHLTDLCHYAHHQGWPLLSSIVVNKDNLKDGLLEPLSLTGFIKAAESLGYQITNGTAFLRDQQRRTFEWGRTQSANPNT